MNRYHHSIQIAGFSLVELLMVIAIVAVLSTVAGPALKGTMQGRGLTDNLNEISDCLQQARATAMASNTYVWVGILPLPQDSSGAQPGTGQVLLAAVAAKNGQPSDLASGNYAALRKGRILKNTTVVQFAPDVLQKSGRETNGVDDISKSSLDSNPQNCQFSQTIGGVKINGLAPVFRELIQFGPQGNARVTATASRWIEIGMQSLPEKNSTNIGILQINGLTGQVRLFRP